MVCDRPSVGKEDAAMTIFTKLHNPDARRGESPSVQTVTLPPGQRLIGGFPRFGKHLARPAPLVPADPVISVRGAVREAVDVQLATLAALPRRALRADFHCVAGWSATNLCWEGVPFEALYRTIIEPALLPGAKITHVVFHGLDGFRSVVWLQDALEDGVLIADRLDGRPLDGDHGAPVRLVSPAQYGYISTKHLCRIEVHAGEPEDARASGLSEWLLRSHPRARVEAEERHGSLPGWLVRPFYRALKAPLLYLCARGRGSR
jgi:DMSO/TMAO reductase YedYZ molybdopterin-dependent catalytic subunit